MVGSLRRWPRSEEYRSRTRRREEIFNGGKRLRVMRLQRRVTTKEASVEETVVVCVESL